MIDTSASQYKILIVDDVPTNVMLVQAILRKEGYALLTADSGVQALRVIRERKPNLVFLDIMMPDMDGYEVLRQIKADPEIKDTPVIIMSALNDMTSIVKGYQLGAAEYVTKPFQREELLKRVSYRFEMYNIVRIKKALENTIASRDSLYSVIAHDLRSPLGTLKMMNNAIFSMIDKKQISPQAYEMLQLMNKTSDEVFQLLDNLLKWAKNRLDKETINYENVDANILLKDTVTLIEPLATFKEIKINVICPELPLYANTDPDMVKTVIRNLINNAIKFSFSGSEIDVSMFAEKDSIIVTVKDHGVGIKEADKYKILNSDLHYSTYGTKDEKGAGLGLILCKEFAEMLNGKLWFETVENKGTTFFFAFRCI